jgi:hypothetical protein
VHEYQIENSDVSDKMLGPELIEAEASGAGIGEHRGRYKRKGCSAERPEIADIEEILVLSDYHKATEDYKPSANGNGKIVNGIWVKLGDADQTPIVSHFGNYHREADGVSESVLVLARGNSFTVEVYEQNYSDADEYGCKVSQREVAEFNFRALTKKIMKKLFHSKAFQNSLIS